MNISPRPIILLLCFSAVFAHAQVPQLLEYDGFLSGNITGNRTVGVRLYNASTNGTLLYNETIGTVKVTQGQFYFQYGQNGTLGNGTTPINLSSCLTGNQNWLAITINGTEQTPRERLLSVPFAFRSADVQSLRNELVAAGVLKSNTTSAISSYFAVAESFWSKNELKEGLEVTYKSGNVASVQPVYNSKDESFETWLTRRLSNNDRITIKDGNYWSNQKMSSSKESLNFTFKGYNNIISSTLRLWHIQPVSEPVPSSFAMNGGIYTASAPLTVDANGNKLIHNGQEYRVVTFFGNQASNAYLINIKVNN
jgi:hypothetical protein